MSPDGPSRSVYTFRGRSYDLSAKTHVMGILNVTPDSFSDGGEYLDAKSAVARGEAMVAEGADFIDVGGESSRPGSEPVTAEEELRRVIPVVERLAAKVDVPISIDTWKAEVARQALKAGASVVNDISAMTMDPEMTAVVAESADGVVLMHMKGTPRSMQQDPEYADVLGAVRSFLAERAGAAENAGIRQIMIDPGIGFGKTVEHNLTLMARLGDLRTLGRPVLVGPSRKSFIGSILGLPPDQRFEGTAAAVAACILSGASVIRVHDVQAMVRVARIADAIRSHA